eukprot:scaffold24333_cov33-Tisochrysis_lutea.AAC.1
MLSTPTPARPMTRSRPAAPWAMAAASRRVADRTITTSCSARQPAASCAAEGRASLSSKPAPISAALSEAEPPSASSTERGAKPSASEWSSASTIPRRQAQGKGRE